MKSLIVSMLFLSMTGIAHAQMPADAGFGPPGGSGPGPRLVEELGLDEYQAAEIAAIFEEAGALHGEQRASCLEAQNAIREETHAAIMALLSADQQVRFLELQQLRAERWGRGPGNGAGNGFGNGPGNGSGKQGGPGDGTCDGTGIAAPEGAGAGLGLGAGNGPGNGLGDCTGPRNCGG